MDKKIVLILTRIYVYMLVYKMTTNLQARIKNSDNGTKNLRAFFPVRASVERFKLIFFGGFQKSR
jgi:hypothetical protein